MSTSNHQTRRLGVAEAVVGDLVVRGDVETTGGAITGVGVVPAGRSGTAVPGFVDLQVNGYAGTSFADVDEYQVVTAAVARRGTTALLATIPTSGPKAYTPALRSIAAAIRRQKLGIRAGANVLGVHLEGPFLSPTRAGAHPHHFLREPDLGVVRSWLELAPIRLVTIAPELVRATEIIAFLLSRGVVVSLGHTNAEAAVAHRAFDLGARAHTHVWNATRPLLARDPGSVGVALSRTDVVPCFIADLAHVAPEVLILSAAAAADRYVVVSDVVAGAGRPPGRNGYDQGEDEVEDEADGSAVRLADGTLAGGGVLLDEALRNLVRIGRALPEAVAAVTSRPATLIGETEYGILRPGNRADVVILDDALEVASVFLDGRMIDC